MRIRARTPAERESLRARILGSPYIDDRVPADALFGMAPQAREPDAHYRVPARHDLFDILNRPLPELPFADPGLVDFAYAPGAMGAVQRAFDRITPEFGFTTDTGFKVRCRWVLVVVGCAWGR